MALAPLTEYEHRVAKARAIMQQHQIDGLIVTDPLNYSYFTGHSVPVWMKSRASIFVLPLSGDPALITWSGPGMFARVYDREFPSWVEDRRIYPDVPFTNDVRVDWGIQDILKDRGLTSGRLAIERGRETWLGIPLDDFERLQEDVPQATFVDSSPVIWGCRLIKSEWELDCLRKACVIGGEAWDKVIAELKPNVSTRTIQQRILHHYAECGADISSGVPMVLGATGPGATFVKGDILYLDGGPSYNGYKMDYTRRAVFGPPSARQQAEHDGMWELMFKVIERMRPGVAVRDLFDYSQQLMAQHPEWTNYSSHPALRIGHGIGLENEPPSMSGTDNTVLEIGMVLTPEPKIESPDGLVNPEEQVAIQDGPPEIMSDCSDYRLRVID